jgi:hypothetical protein
MVWCLLNGLHHPHVRLHYFSPWLVLYRHVLLVLHDVFREPDPVCRLKDHQEDKGREASRSGPRLGKTTN